MGKVQIFKIRNGLTNKFGYKSNFIWKETENMIHIYKCEILSNIETEKIPYSNIHNRKFKSKRKKTSKTKELKD